MEDIQKYISEEDIAKQKKYLWGSIIGLLYLRDDGYPQLDNRIQTIINLVNGSAGLFNDKPKILSIVAWLEDARINDEQFRKDILDAANMIDRLEVRVDV